MQIGSVKLGKRCYIVAELSGNHGGNFGEAWRMIETAVKCGADAVKLQTYDPFDMPDKDETVKGFGEWEGRRWIDVYKSTYLPWADQVRLIGLAQDKGVSIFTTVYSKHAVDYMEANTDLPAYKIPAWLINDKALITYAAATGKPLIMSANDEPEAWNAYWPRNVAWLARDNMDAMKTMAGKYAVPVGYSNHGDPNNCVMAVSLGAVIIEQHFALSKNALDGEFAALPEQFQKMVEAIRKVER